MIDFKKISHQYKTNPIFRQKLIKGSIGLVLIIGFIVFMNYKDNKKQEGEHESVSKQSTNAVMDDYILADTSQIVEDKNIIYEDVNNEQIKNGSEVVINTNSVATVKDDKLNDYLEHRRKTMQSMSNTNSPKHYSSYSSMSSSFPATKFNQREQENENETAEAKRIRIFQEKSKEDFNNYFRKNNSSDKKSLPSDNLVYAIIFGDQTILNGDRVTMRLSKDALINGKNYPRDTYLYGNANFSRNRVNINIYNIGQNSISVTVTDERDGMEGIYVQGNNLTGEVTKEASEDVVNDINVNGIKLGKTLKSIFINKNKENKVFLMNNYPLVIKVK